MRSCLMVVVCSAKCLRPAARQRPRCQNTVDTHTHSVCHRALPRTFREGFEAHSEVFRGRSRISQDSAKTFQGPSETLAGFPSTRQREPRACQDLPKASTGVPGHAKGFHKPCEAYQRLSRPSKDFHRPPEALQDLPKLLQGPPTASKTFRGPPETLQGFPSASHALSKGPQRLPWPPCHRLRVSSGLPKRCKGCQRTANPPPRAAGRLALPCTMPRDAHLSLASGRFPKGSVSHAFRAQSI